MQSSIWAGGKNVRCSGISTAAAATVLVLASSRVSGMAVADSHALAGPQFMIQADGSVARPLAQELRHTDHMQKLVRAEIDDTHSEAVGALAETASHQGTQLVNCSARNLDPIANNFCAILDGSNWQVAGKLERTVKKMHSLAVGVGKDVEEDGLMQMLQASLWELWFCAKRITPKCFPENSTEEKFQMARENAWSALTELQKRAGVVPMTTTAPRSAPGYGIPAVVNLELSASAEAAEQPPTTSQAPGEALRFDRLLQHLNLSVAGGASALHMVNQTEAAIVTLNKIISPPDPQDKLLKAVTDVLRTDTLKKGEIAITDDADGNMKKFKDNLMTLHECASMKDCTAPNDPDCCTPGRPTQAKYLQARDQALEAWGNLDENIRESNKAALDLMKLSAHTTTYYPIGHPLHVPTPAGGLDIETIKKENVENVTEVVHVDDSGSKVLLIAVCVASGVVVLGVLALIGMTMGGKTSGKKKAAAPAADYGEEGYGEEEY